MPGTNTIPASDCTVIVTAPGFPQASYTLAGDATFTFNDPTRELLEDIDTPMFGWKFGKGMMKMTIATDQNLRAIRNLQDGLVVFSYPGNKRLITLNRATQFGDPIEENTNKTGVTNEISISFTTATDTNE